MGTDAATHKTYACTRTHTHTQARLHKPAQAEKEEKKKCQCSATSTAKPRRKERDMLYASLADGCSTTFVRAPRLHLRKTSSLLLLLLLYFETLSLLLI